MHVLIGLGNPGDKYRHTRHNIGFQFLDFFVSGLANQVRGDWKLNKAGQFVYWRLTVSQLVSASRFSVSPLPRLDSHSQSLSPPKSVLRSQLNPLHSPAESIELVKPQTFMNKSGVSVAYLKKKHPQLTGKTLWVIHDDLDLELGSYKIQFGKGPKQHRGLVSIYQQFHTNQFWHIRVGVDGRHGDRHIPADQYVLSVLPPKEQSVLMTTFARIRASLEQQLLSG